MTTGKPKPPRKRARVPERDRALIPERPSAEAFVAVPWILPSLMALGVWWLLRPRSLTVEAGHSYRYQTDIVPPLPNEDAALRLGSAISDAGNGRVTVSPRSASYDVTRSTPTTLTPGSPLTSFEGSELRFRSATRLS